MTTPLLDFPPVLDGLCPHWTPLKLLGFLESWLTQHFGTAANIEEPALRDKAWVPGPESPLLIVPVELWRPAMTAHRPAVLIKQGPIQALQQGLGNRMMGGGVFDGQLHDYRTALVQGSFTCLCLSGQPGECKVLAGEVFQELLKFASLVAARLNLTRVTLPQMGEIGRLGEGRQNYVVPVTTGYAYYPVWEIQPQGVATLAAAPVAPTYAVP